jgi:hypothetical protein
MSNGWALRASKRCNTFPKLMERLGKCARSLWEDAVRFERRQDRTLRLSETLSMGDRRFVAVLEYEQSRFLVGVNSTTFVLLAKLERNDAAGANV